MVCLIKVRLLKAGQRKVCQETAGLVGQVYPESGIFNCENMLGDEVEVEDGADQRPADRGVRAFGEQKWKD